MARKIWTAIKDRKRRYGWTDDKILDVLKIHPQTMEDIRRGKYDTLAEVLSLFVGRMERAHQQEQRHD